MPVQPRPILARKCSLFSCVSVKHILFSFNRRTSFTFRCVSDVISKSSNNVQIFQTVHDIVGYRVSDLISLDIRTVNKASDWQIPNLDTERNLTACSA